MHFLLATSWIDGIVNALSWLVLAINSRVGNLGWSLIILAALIRLLFWPLNTAQFKAFLSMQKIAPQLKILQTRYKDDRERLQKETMALYSANKVNPLAGCWPMLVQYPIIISVYWVVLNHKDLFANQNWFWVGAFTNSASAEACKLVTISAACFFHHPILAPSLANPDLILLLLYAFSMYLSVRYVSMPATDPQQAQTQRMMAVISPLMLSYIGWRYAWPSAMVLYWFGYNIFTMAQQFYLLRRYHQPLALIDAEHVITDPTTDTPAVPKNAALTNGAAKSNPQRSGRSSRSKRRNKKGS